jgi:hypothetical protein
MRFGAREAEAVARFQEKLLIFDPQLEHPLYNQAAFFAPVSVGLRATGAAWRETADQKLKRASQIWR